MDSFATVLVRRRKLPNRAMKRPATKPANRRPVAFTPSRYAGRTARAAISGMINWTCASGDNPPSANVAAHRSEYPGSFWL